VKLCTLVYENNPGIGMRSVLWGGVGKVGLEAKV